MDDHEQDQDVLEAHNDNNTDADILEEQVLEQQMIPFLGDELTAVLTPGGLIYKGVITVITPLSEVYFERRRAMTRSLEL